LRGSIKVRDLQSGSQVVPSGVSLVQAASVWAQGVTGSGVTVCVIDTGMDQGHEDFGTGQLSGMGKAQGANF